MRFALPIRQLRPRRLAALLVLSATLSCSKDSGTEPDPTPSIIQPVSGNNQEATVGTELANPLMVEVLDAKGNPVGGQQVTWTVTAGGGALDPATSVTNSSGIARSFLRVGPAAGENRATAKVGSLPVVTFVATGRPRPVADLVLVGGNSQTASASSQLPEPLVVRAVDVEGHVLPNVSVSFSVVNGGGQVTPTTVNTDANGLASARWTLGATVGQQTARATSGTALFTFGATATQPASRTFSIVSGDAQSGVVGTTLANQIVVRLLEAGSPVVGATIAFTPVSQGTATPSSVATDANGEARTSWRLGTTAGPHSLTVTAPGASPLSATATATPGAAAQLSIYSGNAQTGNINQPLPQPIIAAVADAFGNPVPGATVTFAVTGGGGTITPTSAIADEGGHARATWTLGPNAGAQTATANIPSIGNAQITATATRPLIGLSHRVVDAEFDTTRNRIITVSANPSRLNIVDPETGTTQSVDLGQVPTSVAVQPDGKYAAVGHNAWISYVNLTTRTVERVYSTSCDVIDIVLPGNGYVYAFPRVDQWVSIHTVQLSNGAESTNSGTIRAGTLVRLHPNGKYIYGANNGLSPSDFEKYDIRSGPAQFMYDSPYHGDYAFSGNLWISGDGLRLFARSGNVFRSSEVRAEDMLYAGALQSTPVVQWALQPLTSGRVLVLPGASWDAAAPSELRVFGSDYLAYRGAVVLPKFVLPGAGSFKAEGQYVFANTAASRVYVLVRAEGGSGLAQDWALADYDMSELP
jgi:hypothetical protein